MITIFVGLALGVFVGWTRSGFILSTAIAFVLGAASHLAIGSVAQAMATNPPVLLWEHWILAVCESSPFWFTGAAAAVGALLTSRLVNAPEHQWKNGEPDRRMMADRRRARRDGADRRGQTQALAFRL